MRYLKGTKNLGLLYRTDFDTGLIGFSDSDFAADLGDRKSTCGYMFKLSGAPISWKSKKQASVALSTAEAEYVALLYATQEAVWLRRLISELNGKSFDPTVINEDNQAAISMAQNAVFHSRSKHIDIRHHFLREQISAGIIIIIIIIITLKYCRSDQMLADLLTKGLPRCIFGTLREASGIVLYSHQESETEC